MREKFAQAYDAFSNQQSGKAGALAVLRGVIREGHRRYYDYRHGREYNTHGVDIFDEDWDNLIILDACRFDYFRRHSDLPGRLESRISRGSMSEEFIRGNFTNRQRFDTVYFSDNDWFGKLHDEIDADLYDYSFCERDAFGGLVSHPATVTERAREYDREYSDKRLIVHYMQPHAPYFGTDGQERFVWPSDTKYSVDPTLLQDAYASNLELVLSEVSRLLDSLRGKTVVTSDHGELLGERLFPVPLRQYQHPPGIYVEELVKVPWLVIDGDERKRIVEDPDPDWQGDDDMDAEEIDARLEALGYR